VDEATQPAHAILALIPRVRAEIIDFGDDFSGGIRKAGQLLQQVERWCNGADVSIAAVADEASSLAVGGMRAGMVPNIPSRIKQRTLRIAHIQMRVARLAWYGAGHTWALNAVYDN
jgi:hypothetical protein